MRSFFSVGELLRERLAANRPYLEFLRASSMSCGVYVLAAGAIDQQTAHAEDEIYFVASGTARMNIQNADGKTDDREIAAGDVIFVRAYQEHRFHSITQELVLMVVFAPAETSTSVRRREDQEGAWHSLEAAPRESATREEQT